MRKGQMDIGTEQVIGALFLVVILAASLMAISGIRDGIATDDQVQATENYTVNSTATYTLLQGGIYILNSETATGATSTFTRDTNYSITAAGVITWLSANGNNSQVNVTYNTQPSSTAYNTTSDGLSLGENISTQFGTVGTLIGVGILIAVVFIFFRVTGRV